MIRKIIYIIAIILFGFFCFKLGQRSVKFNAYIEAREAAADKAQFDKNFEAMTTWIENYKKEHPNATDQEVQEAYKKALEGL